MAFLSNYLRRLTFNQGYQGVQGTSNSTQGLQGISGVQGTVGTAGTTLLTNTQSGTYTLQRSDIGEVVSGVSTVGFSSNTFNPGESVIILNNNLNQTVLDVAGANPVIKFYEEGVGTAITFSKRLKNKSFVNVLCARINEFIIGGSLFDIPINATGGTIIDDAGFRIHVFTGTGPFNVTYASPLSTVEYVVVAGGGAGGGISPSPSYGGGGGGAGGFRTGTNFPVTVQNYTITVGAGGTTGATNGGNSVFSTITSTGGGRGGGNPGGSGGGGSYNTALPEIIGGTGNTPPVSPPQGNNGGNSGPIYWGGGGGGAGASGTTADFPTITGTGGIGTSVTWVPGSYGTPGPAPGRYFAGGGGGGGSLLPGSGSAGGSGGGGSGRGPGLPVVPGTVNTGGGGGGGATVAGGSGGSGIVIIRYPIT